MASGQLLTGSFMDYAMPRATDSAPSRSRAIRCRPRPIRSASRAPAKPAASARMPAVANALVDALSDFGVRHIEMPATPERLWRAISQANGK